MRVDMVGGEGRVKGGNRTLFRSQMLVGHAVVTPHGEDLGRIEELVIDPLHGRIEYAAISFGEPFGTGEKLFAVPWEALWLDSAHHSFVMDIERTALEAGQGFDPEVWPTTPDRSMFPPREPPVAAVDAPSRLGLTRL